MMTNSRPLPVYNYEDYVPMGATVCPICETPFTSLQGLNTHLDTAHNEEDTKGALLSWFRNAQKKVQTTLQTKSPSSSSVTVERSFKQFVDPSIVSGLQNLGLSSGTREFFVNTGQENVRRDHWQRDNGNEQCGFYGCFTGLGKSGQHCRQCGGLFCIPHTQYEVKLDAQARHDPEHGVWCKVCRSCYVSREGYLGDHLGATRDVSSVFLERRNKNIDRVHLDCNRLEKRLEKLARIHYVADKGKSGSTPAELSSRTLGSPSPSLSSISLERSESTSSRGSGSSSRSPKGSIVSSSNSILSMKLKYRDGEQTVTKWEDDRPRTQCPLCSSTFTLTNRKHHCRLCGRVVCGYTRCSSMIPLFLNMASDTFDEEPVGDTRACSDCKRAVFRRKLKNIESLRPPPIVPLYEQLAKARNAIERQLPKFHEMVLMLEKEKIAKQSHESFERAAQLRQSLLSNFALVDALAKKIKALPTKDQPLKRRLQDNVCAAVNLYLQRNMMPLQMLPRILNADKGKTKDRPTMQNGQCEQEVQLKAYEDQRHLLETTIREATLNRKYDDVKILTNNLDEVDQEIKRLKSRLA